MARRDGFDYDPGDYPPFAVTVDVAVFTIRDDALQVLLVERGGEPFLGAPALPGGFVRPDEDLDRAAARELAEETGLTAGSWHLEQLAAYGAPDRDPRMRVVTVAYWAICADLPALRGGGDAVAAALMPVEKIERGDVRLAFDHERIVKDAVERTRSRLEHTALAVKFCPPAFTIGQLRRVYEAVWRRRLDPGNFQRNVQASGAFEPSPGRAPAPGSHRGRPASLWSVTDSAALDLPAAPLDRAPAKRMGRARREPIDGGGGTGVPQLPRAEYAAVLCDALGDYGFPKVTWDFRRATETRHESMSAVEERVGELLRSGDPGRIRDGLSNVLYWGYARQPGRRDSKVRDFRNAVPEDDPGIAGVAELARSLAEPPAAAGRSGLLAVKKLKLRQFGQVSFASKILMFLDPTRFPVLDLKIARAFANGGSPPLAGLGFGPGGIPITRRNAHAYGDWARWCGTVAAFVNEEPASPRRDLRAVDVERALFTLVDSGAMDKAWALLKGPEGTTFDSEPGRSG